MALSNWDTLAFDTNGNPGSGDLVLPDGSGVNLYKNWLYVIHPKMWCEDCGYSKPTIASVNEGELTIGHMHIYAIRHDDQNSIFTLIEAWICGEDGNIIDERQYMCGIGCYGYMDELEYLENSRADLLDKLGEQACKIVGDDWRSRIASCGKMICYGESPRWIFNFDGSDKEIYLDIDHEPDLGDLWCGVKPSTLAAFHDWLKKLHGDYVARDYIDKVIATIEADKSLRFNQGDRYFAEAGIVDPSVATPVGKCNDPVMGDIIKKIFPPAD